MTVQYSVQGNYGKCVYTFIPNVHNREFTALAEEYSTFCGEHLPLVNFIKRPTPRLFLGDGGVTKTSGIKMAITCHDCIPLIFMNSNGDGAALIHLSWKNLYLKILDNVFSVFQLENIDPSSLQVIIGPHIRKENLTYGLESIWFDHDYYQKRFFIQDNNITYFDMSEMVKSVLIKYGIKQEKILDTNIDTFTNEKYASFRRNGINSSQTNIFTLEIL